MRRSGKVTTVIVTLVVIALICGAAWFATQTIMNRYVASGRTALEAGNYAAALEAFKKADKLALRPFPEAMSGMAECYLQLEDYDNARDCYAKLIKLEPENAKARYTMGLLYIRAKNYEGVEKEAKALRGLGTTEGNAYADALAAKMQTGMVKGFFQNLLKKIAPSLPTIPGLTDDAPVDPDEETPSTESDDTEEGL